MDSDNDNDTNDVMGSENESRENDADIAMPADTLDDYPYEVLSTEEVVQYMVDCTKEVNTVIEMPAATIRILLNHFKWDKDKLIDRFYDGDRDLLLSEAKVIDPFRKPVPQTTKGHKRIAKSSETEPEECEICFSALPSSLIGLGCGHAFCSDCWCDYLTTKIMEDGLGPTIECAAHTCDVLVDDETAMRLVRDPQVKLKYQQNVTNNFVMCNRLLRWCPTPECGAAVKVPYVKAAPVACRCRHTFCFACGETWHYPVRCAVLRQWAKIADGFVATWRWYKANAKQCPKCYVTIEKTGGCNKMTCQNCYTAFCWACLGDWKDHDKAYNCNRYDENTAQTVATKFKRCVFYSSRYMNHKVSLRLEYKLHKSVDAKMEVMQQHKMRWIEVQFLKEAVDILCQCRRTLMYTYVFAFYLRKSNQKGLFEDNQRDLELATETLSRYLEQEVTAASLVDIEETVQNKYRYCDRRRKVLLEQVQEGYEKNWWSYIEL